MIAEEGECEVRGVKLRTVLGVLVVHAGRPVSPDALIDAVWGDEPPTSATGTLQNYVYQLRRRLGAEMIRTQPTGYTLEAARTDVDGSRFEDALREASAAPGADPGHIAACLGEALGWWRGPVLADFGGAEWTRPYTARLDLMRLDAIERLIDARLELGEHVAVTPELEDLIARHTLRERFYAQLMLSLYRSGRQADALRVYTRLRRILQEELGVDPSRELAALNLALLSQARELDAPHRQGTSAPVATVKVAEPPPTGVAHEDVGIRARRPRARRVLTLGAAAFVAAAIVVVATLVAVDGRGAARSAVAAAPGYTPRYHAIRCPGPETQIDIHRDSSEQCGVLTVPENRARPDGRTIDLVVFRFPSISPHPAADPIVQVGADFTASEEPSNPDLRTRGDSIYLAGRGFYGSDPYLGCTAVAVTSNTALGRPSSDPRNKHDVMQAVDACRARWAAAGIDLAAYTPAETADDVRDLARAVHLRHINLLAARDMTIEARDIAGRYPDLVRSITLLDVVPPDQNQWNGAIANANGALDRLVAECNRQPVCATKYPHIRNDLLQAFRSLQATPATFVENNPFGAVPAHLRLVLDGGRMMQLVVGALESGNAGIIPATLTTGDTQGAASDALFALTSPDVAWGALLSVNCSSEARTVSATALDSEAAAAPSLAYLADDPILRMCPHWITGPTHTPDTAIGPGPVIAPTLILIGALDPSTSADWAQQTAQIFTHSRIVVLPHTGNVASTTQPCVAHIRSAFIARPQQTRPADTCQTDIPPLHFTGT